jgi:hypothetical protein
VLYTGWLPRLRGKDEARRATNTGSQQLIFDKKWDHAEQKLSELLNLYPGHISGPCPFYKGKCCLNKKEKNFRPGQAFEEF